MKYGPEESSPKRVSGARSDRFASLGEPNFRLFFCAQIFSYVGTWVQIMSENWLVLQMTQSAFALGVTTALHWGPMVFLGLHGGLLADRVDARKLLLVTQALMAALALGLALVVALEVARIWMIWLAAGALGVLKCVDIPASQKLPRELVGTSRLSNAIALNNAVASAGRAVGPAIGGIVVATLGAEVAFLLNAGSFVLVVAALAALNPERMHRAAPVASAPGQVREGLTFLVADAVLLRTFVVALLVFTLVFNFQVFLPVVAHTLPNGTSVTYGLLMSALGVGGLTGSIWFAGRVRTSDAVLAFAILALALALGVLSVATQVPMALASAFLLGAAAGVFAIVASTRFQHRARDDIRGRVMAIFAIAFLGTGMIGGPVVGAMTEWVGLAETLRLVMVACIAIAFVVMAAGWRRGDLRDDVAVRAAHPIKHQASLAKEEYQ